MNVTAIIVTRGDVDLTEIVDSLPEEWEVVIWDNGMPSVRVAGVCEFTLPSIQNLGVYGRYAAIEHASHDLIYVQDDDCVVSDPEALVTAWRDAVDYDGVEGRVTDPRGFVVCNMPPEFRHGFYEEHSLVGFGAAFHRDAPQRAFDIFFRYLGATFPSDMPHALAMASAFGFDSDPNFLLTCDVVFTALTPRVLVDVPKTNLFWADDPTRMYRQPRHQAERGLMLELACRAKDAADG